MYVRGKYKKGQLIISGPFLFPISSSNVSWLPSSVKQ